MTGLIGGTTPAGSRISPVHEPAAITTDGAAIGPLSLVATPDNRSPSISTPTIRSANRWTPDRSQARRNASSKRSVVHLMVAGDEDPASRPGSQSGKERTAFSGRQPLDLEAQLALEGMEIFKGRFVVRVARHNQRAGSSIADIDARLVFEFGNEVWITPVPTGDSERATLLHRSAARSPEPASPQPPTMLHGPRIHRRRRRPGPQPRNATRKPNR